MRDANGTLLDKNAVNRIYESLKASIEAYQLLQNKEPHQIREYLDNMENDKYKVLVRDYLNKMRLKYRHQPD